MARIGVTRRGVLASAGALPLATSALARPLAGPLPDRASFAPMPGVYLDSGTMHPVPLGARDAARAYLDQRATMDGHYPTDEIETRVKASFARLINATPEEIAFVQSTTAGEQAIIDALGFPREKGRIVTDTLHFFGSFYLYEELARQGVKVVWLRPRERSGAARIAIDDIEKAIVPGTRLVALSLVSTYNGFEHDLKRVCEIAHTRGALVYADIVHAAGAVPFDVRASNVDFASCASYKWLMGDFGLGLLYVRADLHDRLTRTRFGYYQLAGFAPHVYPFDPPATRPDYPIADVTPRPDMEGLFAGGTHAHTVSAMLGFSLDYILMLGVERITAYRQPLLARLHEGLASRGYTVVTPPESCTPLVTCVLEGAHARLADPLKAAGVQITLSRNRFRICPSVFNGMDDIERLLAALPPLNLPKE